MNPTPTIIGRGTDKQRVRQAFNMLEQHGFTTAAGEHCCSTCAHADLSRSSDRYVFYNAQTDCFQRGSIAHPNALYLGWQGDPSALEKICDTLELHGLTVERPTAPDRAIVVLSRKQRGVPQRHEIRVEAFVRAASIDEALEVQAGLLGVLIGRGYLGWLVCDLPTLIPADGELDARARIELLLSSRPCTAVEAHDAACDIRRSLADAPVVLTARVNETRLLN